jgi:ubiquitin
MDKMVLTEAIKPKEKHSDKDFTQQGRTVQVVC